MESVECSRSSSAGVRQVPCTKMVFVARDAEVGKSLHDFLAIAFHSRLHIDLIFGHVHVETGIK